MASQCLEEGGERGPLVDDRFAPDDGALQPGDLGCHLGAIFSVDGLPTALPELVIEGHDPRPATIDRR
jgi:hypothetical protein